MTTQLFNQLKTLWGGLRTSQRIAMIVLGILGIVLVFIFIAWANTPTYAVAFNGLSESDAGQIVEKLAEEGMPYQLRGVGTILVPSDKVYEVRLKMARIGLPQGGTVGFELFSGNTSFGMTEFTQRVNYQRALEGELERTISSMSAVEAVRVHIVIPEKALLSGDQSPATASVTIKERAGQRLDSAQVRAITHLVASSVEGMQPENVVVVDVEGNLLAAGASEANMPSAQTDQRRAAEIAVAQQMQQKVQHLLDSVLGPNRSVVQADVRLDWTERETKRQTFDPTATVVRSSQVISESYQTNGGVIGGIPGSETNLPPATGEATSEGASSDYRRTENITNYEITQTEVNEITPPGQIERVSLSVLVDGVTDAAELDKLQSAIAAAVGIDETQGDILSVESLSFDRSYYEEKTAELENSRKMDLYIKIGQSVLAVLILAFLLWYVQRLLSRLKVASIEAWTPILKPVAEVALPQGALTESIPPIQQTPQYTEEALPSLKDLVKEFDIPTPSPEDEELQHNIVELAQENPASLAEIIQMWLSEDEG